MYKLPHDIPSSNAKVEDLADYYECECLKSEVEWVAFHNISREIRYQGDEIEVVGIMDEDDFLSNKLDEITAEIERRKLACKGKYPFQSGEKGYVLELNHSAGKQEIAVYNYLLLATRLNMGCDRVHKEIDGSLLFEELSAIIAQSYWGDRAESYVFGTAIKGKFSEKVDELCFRMGEGDGFQNRNPSPPKAKDDNLDVAVWKSFQDEKVSKLIGFGQCKTGTSWSNHTTDLQPSDFCGKWMKNRPAVNPVCLFFISDSLPSNEWFTKAVDAGIVFDRYRIMDYLPSKLDDKLLENIESWVESAWKFVMSN